jgi:uncharacterized protein involved in exopolysaccharide biosynthesis
MTVVNVSKSQLWQEQMHIDVTQPQLHEHDDIPQTQYAAQRERGDGEISVLDLMIALAEQRSIILLVTSAFAILGIIVSLVLPKVYTATAIILPPQQNSSMGSALASQLGGMAALAGGGLAGGGLGLKNPNDMYISMFKSRTVEEAMVKRFGLMQEYGARHLSDAGKAFEGHAHLDGSGKDGLIRISVDDRDPLRAAELANGYVDEFRNLSQHLAITEASQRRLFFERELELAKTKLGDAEEAMKETEQRTGAFQVDGQARALIESAVTLRAQMTAKEVQIQGMRTYATGENAQLVQAQQELDTMRAQLAKLGGSEESASIGLVVPKGRIPEVGLEYARKLRDVKYGEAILDIMARQFEVAKLDEAKQGSLIQVVDSAVPPDRRSSPRRGLIAILATIFGFLIAVCTALIRAGFQNLKKNAVASQKLTILWSCLFSRRI